MSAFEIYLIMQVDVVRDTLGGVTFILFVSTIGALVVGALENIKGSLKVAKFLTICTLIAAIPLATVPSTKTLVAMYSIPTLLEAAQSEQMTEIGQKSLKAVDKLLSDYLEAEGME